MRIIKDDETKQKKYLSFYLLMTVLQKSEGDKN